MAQYTGKIEAITEEAKEKNGKPYVKYALKVNGKWYGTFLNDKNEAMLRSVARYDDVVVTTKLNGQYENLDSVTKAVQQETPKSTVVNAASLSPAQAIPAPRMEESVSRAVGRLDDKDFRITYLACRRDAMDLVKYMVDKGILPIGTGKEKQAGNVYEYVRRYGLALAHDAWNVRPEDAKTLSAEEMDSKKASEQKMEE